MHADDERFERWWAAVAVQQIAQYPLAMHWEEKLKQGGKQIWDASQTWEKDDLEETTDQ
jgi:hypothetical protein